MLCAAMAWVGVAALAVEQADPGTIPEVTPPVYAPPTWSPPLYTPVYVPQGYEAVLVTSYDTWSSIAVRFAIPPDELARTYGARPVPGATLILPRPSAWEVKVVPTWLGEDIHVLASRFGVSPARAWAWNPTWRPGQPVTLWLAIGRPPLVGVWTPEQTMAGIAWAAIGGGILLWAVLSSRSGEAGRPAAP